MDAGDGDADDSGLIRRQDGGRTETGQRQDRDRTGEGMLGFLPIILRMACQKTSLMAKLASMFVPSL